MSDVYQHRADLHRPVSHDALAAEAQRLRAQGLTHEDIGMCLRLSADAVRVLLDVQQGDMGYAPSNASAFSPETERASQNTRERFKIPVSGG